MAHQVRMRKFEPVPNGMYPAVFQSFEETKTKYGMSYYFYFEITSPIGNLPAGQSVRGLVSPQLTPKSKLARWIRAMGVDMQENDTLDLETLFGRQVTVEIEQTISGDAVYSNVKDVKSIQVLQQAAAAFQQTAPVTQTQQPVTQQPTTTVQQPVQTNTVQQPATTQPASAPVTNINVSEDEILF